MKKKKKLKKKKNGEGYIEHINEQDKFKGEFENDIEKNGEGINFLKSIFDFNSCSNFWRDFVSSLFLDNFSKIESSISSSFFKSLS